MYPPNWPRCVFCGDHALDGHLTCGRASCPEGRARDLRARNRLPTTEHDVHDALEALLSGRPGCVDEEGGRP